MAIPALLFHDFHTFGANGLIKVDRCISREKKDLSLSVNTANDGTRDWQLDDRAAWSRHNVSHSTVLILNTCTRSLARFISQRLSRMVVLFSLDVPQTYSPVADD